MLLGLLECILFSAIGVGIIWFLFSAYLKKRSEKQIANALTQLNRHRSFSSETRSFSKEHKSETKRK
jgi:hypothetical protein